VYIPPPLPILEEDLGAALGLGAERKALPPTRPPDLAAHESSGSAVVLRSIPAAAATKTFFTLLQREGEKGREGRGKKKKKTWT